MSVYKEAVHILKSLESQQVRIYADACDFGTPISKGDFNWKAVKQLFEWYGIRGTRKQHNYSTGLTVEGIVEYMPQEHVNDKFVKVKVTYTTCNFRNTIYKGEGFITIERL